MDQNPVSCFIYSEVHGNTSILIDNIQTFGISCKDSFSNELLGIVFTQISNIAILSIQSFIHTKVDRNN